MMCPYNRKTLKQVIQVDNDLVDEENGVLKSSQSIIVEEYTPQECKKEECGAWKHDECCYYGS